MPPSLATTPRRPLRPVAFAFACALATLSACSTSAPAPARLTEDVVARCRQVEIAFQTDAPDYVAKRDAVASDERAAPWLVRMFVAHVVACREGTAVDEGAQSVVAPPKSPADLELAAQMERLRAEDQRAARDQVLGTVAAERTDATKTAGAGARPFRGRDEVERRAIAELVALGAIAVPVLVQDLLLHEQPHLRELGGELLAHVGAPAVPALQRVTRSGAPKQRRAAARALGRIGVDANVLATLRELAADGDYTVRADSLRALRDGGPDAQALLVERLRGDDDPFVRRVAADTLAHFENRTAALALADYLEHCIRTKDVEGERTAHRALAAMSRDRAVRTTAAWREWAGTLPDAAPGRPTAPRGR
jgi:hypothetical protein